MATSDEKPEVTMIDRDRDSRHDAEKAPIARTIENIRVLGLSDEDAAFYQDFPAQDRKRILRKVSAAHPSCH